MSRTPVKNGLLEICSSIVEFLFVGAIEGGRLAASWSY